MRFMRPFGLLLALSLLAAACGGDGSKTGATVDLTTLPPVAQATTTTAAPETTTSSTTAAPNGPVSLLNGLPVQDEELLERRVIAVKIDNHPEARPQSGLEEAGAVMEVLVEGGITRFIALYHDTDSEYLGPIRSGRPTDPTLVLPLDATFQISGAQDWVYRIINGMGVTHLGETPPNTFRIPRGSRAYERTLYGSTLGMREAADSRGFSDDPPPGPWFSFGEEASQGSETAEMIRLRWSGDWPAVRWEWDGEHYLRFNGQNPHEWVDQEGEGEQIAFDTLLVLVADRYTASPPAGASGSSVPAMRTTGTNTALLFHDGMVVEGTWERAENEDFFTLTTVDGNTMVLPPGSLWVSVFPDGRTYGWE